MSPVVDFTVGAALIAAVLVAIAAGVALLDAAGSAVALVWRRVVARPSSAGPEHNPSRRDHPVTVSKLARIAPQAREAGISGATPSDGAEDARSATQDAAGEALASVGPSDATGVPPEANRPQQAAQALSGPLPGEGGNEARAETGPEDGRCVSFSLGEFCADPSGGIPVAPKANARSEQLPRCLCAALRRFAICNAGPPLAQPCRRGAGHDRRQPRPDRGRRAGARHGGPRRAG